MADGNTRGQEDTAAALVADIDNSAQSDAASTAEAAEAAPSSSEHTNAGKKEVKGASAGIKAKNAAFSDGEAADAVASDNTADEEHKEAASGEDAQNNENHDHTHEPTDGPSKELALENVYNPRNLTWDELEMLLYEWEEEATPAINEYLDMRVVIKQRADEVDDEWEKEQERDDDDYEEREENKHKGWMDRLKGKPKHHDDGSKTQVEFKKGPTHYLNLTEGVAHVVEFYAPWCPHCQHYKWDYVELAAEVKRRSITPVEFHAVSCDVYYAICSTYGVHSYPTILGWKIGDSFAIRGIGMNEEEELEADTAAEMLDLDIAHEAVELFDWEIEDEDERKQHDIKIVEQGHKAAKKKLSWHNHEPHTHNDRYHNAALSLAFAVKSQLFQTLTEDGKMEPKRKVALTDFLNLLDWATPQSWKLRTSFIKELHWKMSADAVANRKDVEHLINGDQKRHRSMATEDLWGFVDASSDSSWKGKMFSGQLKEQLVKDDKHWSKTCTHAQPAKGFTCGLWNLFHILTIGSSKLEHELYGFHRGYFVSPHHVAETIRNFIAYFFSCEVCRTNYLKMYDNCGHDHCNRLISEITMGPTDGSDPARMELALWLWEVHNSVNARLMKEAAQRQNREVTHEETLASKFPTKKLCPDCWLDANMTKWDNVTVFHFLDEWYWPSAEPANKQFKSVVSGMEDLENEMPIEVEHHHIRVSHHEHSKVSNPKPRVSMGFTALFCVFAFALLVAVVGQHKRRVKRKKFVDSRFVQKKSQGCLG